MARLDFRRFHRNRCVSSGSNGAHWTTFLPFSSPGIKVLFTLPVSSYDQTSRNSSGLHCTSDLIFRIDFRSRFRLDPIRPRVLSTGIWLIILGLCGGGREERSGGRRGRGRGHGHPRTPLTTPLTLAQKYLIPVQRICENTPMSRGNTRFHSLAHCHITEVLYHDYRKLPLLSPGLCNFLRAFIFIWAYKRVGGLFSRELISRGVISQGLNSR